MKLQVFDKRKAVIIPCFREKISLKGRCLLRFLSHVNSYFRRVLVLLRIRHLRCHGFLYEEF